MRALKTLMVILGVVVALVLVLGILGPGRSHVVRETVIAAPGPVVWDHLRSLKKHNGWSPFLAMDPDMKVTYEGTDGAVGSKSSWEGGKSGKGEQVIAAVDSGKRIDVDLHFMEPFEAQATASLVMQPMADSTRVTWTYDGKNGFISRIIAVFKNMDSMLGPVFDDGLARLKQVAEADATAQKEALAARTFRGYTVETEERPATTYCGKRQKVGWDKLGAFFGAAFPATAEALGKAGVAVTGAPSALIFEWDTIAKAADVLAGLPVADTTAKVAGLVLAQVPAGKVLAVAYHGAYEGTGKAHAALEDMMKAHGLALRAAEIEEYVTDPTQEPDTAKWLTNIYYPVR